MGDRSRSTAFRRRSSRAGREQSQRGRGQDVVFVLGVVDVGPACLLGARMGRFLQRGKGICRSFCHQHRCSLVSGNTPPTAFQNPNSAVTDRQHRGAHRAAFTIAQRVGPRLRPLAEPVSQGHEFFCVSSVAHPDHHLSKHTLSWAQAEPSRWIPPTHTLAHVVRVGRQALVKRSNNATEAALIVDHELCAPPRSFTESLPDAIDYRQARSVSVRQAEEWSRQLISPQRSSGSRPRRSSTCLICPSPTSRWSEI